MTYEIRTAGGEPVEKGLRTLKAAKKKIGELYAFDLEEFGVDSKALGWYKIYDEDYREVKV